MRFPQVVENHRDRIGTGLHPTEVSDGRLGALFCEVLDRCHHEVFLGAEMVYLRASGDTGNLGHFVRRRARIAISDQALHRGVEKARAHRSAALSLRPPSSSGSSASGHRVSVLVVTRPRRQTFQPDGNSLPQRARVIDIPGGVIDLEIHLVGSAEPSKDPARSLGHRIHRTDHRAQSPWRMGQRPVPARSGHDDRRNVLWFDRHETLDHTGKPDARRQFGVDDAGEGSPVMATTLPANVIRLMFRPLPSRRTRIRSRPRSEVLVVQRGVPTTSIRSTRVTNSRRTALASILAKPEPRQR